MNDKITMQQILNIRYIAMFLRNGVVKIVSNVKIAICAAIAVLICGYFVFANIPHVDGAIGKMCSDLYTFAALVLGTMLLLCAIWFVGAPKGYLTIMQHMYRVGMLNAAGEAPVLVQRQKSLDKPRVELWTYETFGVPFSSWLDYAERLESALDIAFLSAEPGRNGRTVLLRVIPHPGPWPKMLLWDNSLISPKESVLVLGENRSEQVTLDLAVVPHLLIAGRTGSGKSVLQKSLMLQALLHGMEIILVDYKLGVDYGKNWRKYCEFICDDYSFLGKITDLQREMMRRFNFLNESDCSNIQEYNSKGGNLHRICLFIDEIVECFDRKDVSAEQKKILAAISLSISSICRLGRAAGIHVVLATQRGSADVLPGQIRSNVFKMLGSADENLSILTLGNADAAKKIPADAQGRFIDERGNMFQSYYSEYGDDVFAPIENREAHR